MTLTAQGMHWVVGGGAVVVVLLLIMAFGSDSEKALGRRLARVSVEGGGRKLGIEERVQNAVRSTSDSGIPLFDRLIKMLPNPNKLRQRIARTGHSLPLGEYLLMNALAIGLFFLLFHVCGLSKLVGILLAFMLGLGLPHLVTGYMGAKRIKKFLASFPEAIDTMCRGLRSGLPITESVAAVGREMPEPVGTEFHRIADGVRMGKSLEAAMWEVAQRINVPEFRFLIIAMAIQKETGGNLAETLGNLSDLIRRRRQLRLKIKAMSSEARASAMIIGSLPFIMFTLLMIVNSAYMMTLFQSLRGEIMLGGAITWMAIGWGTMTKMIHFEI
jgi:tight adherence protein B